MEHNAYIGPSFKVYNKTILGCTILKRFMIQIGIRCKGLKYKEQLNMQTQWELTL